MDQWLVRTAKNVVSGPFSKDHLCELVVSGKFSTQDEVCPANGYWIFLHEAEEVKKQLGIEVPKNVVVHDEEVTNTDTNTTSLDAQRFKTGSQEPGAKGAFRPKAVVFGKVERTSIWRALMWVLLLVLAALVVSVLRLLKPQ